MASVYDALRIVAEKQRAEREANGGPFTGAKRAAPEGPPPPVLNPDDADPEDPFDHWGEQRDLENLKPLTPEVLPPETPAPIPGPVVSIVPGLLLRDSTNEGYEEYIKQVQALQAEWGTTLIQTLFDAVSLAYRASCR